MGPLSPAPEIIHPPEIVDQRGDQEQDDQEIFSPEVEHCAYGEQRCIGQLAEEVGLISQNDRQKNEMVHRQNRRQKQKKKGN